MNKKARGGTESSKDKEWRKGEANGEGGSGEDGEASCREENDMLTLCLSQRHVVPVRDAPMRTTSNVKSLYDMMSNK